MMAFLLLFVLHAPAMNKSTAAATANYSRFVFELFAFSRAEGIPPLSLMEKSRQKLNSVAHHCNLQCRRTRGASLMNSNVVESAISTHLRWHLMKIHRHFSFQLKINKRTLRNKLQNISINYISLWILATSIKNNLFMNFFSVWDNWESVSCPEIWIFHSIWLMRLQTKMDIKQIATESFLVISAYCILQNTNTTERVIAL